MPATSLDTFANTNPAFCACVLRAFVEGYLKSNPEGVPLPNVVLPLPIVLSRGTRRDLRRDELCDWLTHLERATPACHN